MLGIRKAEALGGSSLVGYIPDSFGHIAQLVIFLPTLSAQAHASTWPNVCALASLLQPQMLLGFDITSAVSGRGPGPKQPSEVPRVCHAYRACAYLIQQHLTRSFVVAKLWWQSPDGSRVLFIHLRRWYCNGLDMPRKDNTYGLSVSILPEARCSLPISSVCGVRCASCVSL
jgi:hypothetical protein